MAFLTYGTRSCSSQMQGAFRAQAGNCRKGKFNTFNTSGCFRDVIPDSLSISSSLQGYEGSSLFYRLYNSFGYLNTVGYGGHLFPIIIGEVGSKFQSSTDLASLADFSSWLTAAPNTGVQHTNVMYTSLNQCLKLCQNASSRMVANIGTD